ncbi:uncharacterized protein LOC123306150 [Chrysoperla carnea]|uniref:uncharacterized protein LOC123306150 n=1 Tax=Chrysoperla carnea TaxID=189513 RepID=UPI001D0869DA|nr:uncharacterized protein LOC123306150 [Chrysoperla carnea]
MAQELIIYGGDLKVPPCERNFSQYVLDKMAENSNKIAQIDPVNKITQTFGELRLNSIRCALKMKQDGLKRGDMIMICGRNHLDLVVPFLGAMYLGVTINPLHPDYSRNEILRMIKITEPKIIFCDQECTNLMTELITEAKLQSKIVTFETDFKSYLKSHKSTEEDNFITEIVDVNNDILCIICTSGTTGLIKGVTVTHKAFYYAILTCGVGFVSDEDSPLLYYSPLSWISAVMLINTAIWNGVSRIMCEYEPKRNLEIMLEYNISWLFVTPIKAYEMVNHPLFKQNISKISKNLKYFLFGGSPSSEKHVKEYHQIFPNTFIFNGYGSSEMAGCHGLFVRNKHESMLKQKIMSSGQPISGIYWKIIDPETGKTVGRNKEGELCVKGPTITKGYYKDPEATAKAIIDGWFHTGDIVKVDDENCLWVVGRSKELFKYKGWQVSPSELEDVLRTHPAVQAVSVMGKPHETDGDLPLAFIVKKESAKNVTEDEIIKFVDKQVADCQKLRGGVIFLDALPVTPTGKIRKMVLKQLINYELIDPVNKKSQTFGELRLNSIRCALKMKQDGLKRGDMIMICGRNHLDLVVPLLGAMYLGVTINPLHPDYSRKSTNLMTELITEAKLQSKIVTFETDFKSYLKPHKSTEEDNFITEIVDVSNDILCIICTSGTTGLIKGVTVTHKAFYVSLQTSGLGPSLEKHVKEYHQIFPNTFILNGYGSSEMAGCHALFVRNKHESMLKQKIMSSGQPLAGAYWKIIDPQTGKTVDRNKEGELCIKSSTLTKGYYKDPEATAKAIIDGWFHTGDIVQVDEENCLWIVGRSKELLKYKGWQVSPNELEDVLRTHPAVQAVSVVGKPHETDGDLPLAFIVKKESAKNVTEDEIIEFLDINKITQTFGELRLNSIRCALKMKQDGLKRGDMIMICGRNHLDLVVPLLGAMYLGVTINPLHPDYSRKSTNLMTELITEAKLQSKIVTFETDFKSYLKPHKSTEEDNFVTEIVDVNNDILCIICTSGTTGLIKGVTITHEAFYVSLQTWGVGPTSEKYIQKYHELLPNTFIFNWYGSSEMTDSHGQFVRNKHESMLKEKIMSSGQPLNGMYWKVIDPETGKTVGRNKEGELCIKGPTLTKGYYNDPEATAKAIIDGWLHTGDIVKVDDENCLWVVGRSKELLKYKGWQVSPSELEDVLRTHPAVQAVGVMGKPHETDGDLPLAFIVKKESAKNVTEDEIIKFVDSQVADCQKLRGGVIFLDALPVTPSGKIRKMILKQLIK